MAIFNSFPMGKPSTPALDTSDANATEADVLMGETFYAGGTGIKVGQLSFISDPIWDRWVAGADAPASVYLYISHLYNGKIYCPESGGTAMHIYDIQANTWSTGAAAPVSVNRYTSQLYNGKIYCPQDAGTAMHIYE